MTSSIKAKLNINTRLIRITHLQAKLNSAETLLNEIKENNYTVADIKASLNSEIKIIKKMQNESDKKETK